MVALAAVRGSARGGAPDQEGAGTVHALGTVDRPVDAVREGLITDNIF